MSNLPANLPIGINTLEKKPKPPSKFRTILKNIFVNNFGLKLLSLGISIVMWCLYAAFV